MADLVVPPDERADRDRRTAGQAERLALLLRRIHGSNRFYTRKLEEAGISNAAAVRLPADFEKLPMRDEVRPLILKENAVKVLGLK